MHTADIYADIAKRTGGHIYLGVIGPVRTGKSTFIKRFMESLVIPNIKDDFQRERARDELPQSGSGRTVMTAGTRDFASPEDAEASPLAEAIFDLGDVTGVFFGRDFVSVTAAPGVDWFSLKGDVVAILGASGSGKSTFLRCINLLEQPQQGRIVVAGEELRLRPGRNDGNGGALEAADRRQLQRLRSRLAMVFQHFNLWAHMTVLQNITEVPLHVLGLPRDEAVARARKYLQLVGLEGREDTYPGHMSGGQQQRVAIARALAVEPEVMLFDEPTSALDPELVGEVLNVVENLAEQGMTLIMVTHEMNFARKVSDRIVFMHHGKVHESGAPEQLFGNPQTAELRQFLGSTH